MSKNTYITLTEALRLAREQHPETTFNQLYYYFYRCGLKGRWPNRSKLGGRLFRPQEYRRLEVLELLAGFTPPRPKHEHIYRATCRPGEGWMRVEDIATITGAQKKRITGACSALALPGRIYGKKVWTRLDLATEYLAWRRPGFVRRHMSEQWIAERRAEMKRKNMVPPPTLRNPLYGAIYAPELIHL
jgi:hypothetical protein